MRIAVVGAGAMGALFGARFAAAGADVVLLDRDAAHIAAIAADGLALTAPDGTEQRHRLAATTDPAAVADADLALVMVDGNATPAVAAMLAGHLPRDAYALTLQNGIGNVEALVAALGPGRVMAGSTYNSAARPAPGRVAHTNLGETTIGEIDGRASERLAAIAALFEAAGLPVTPSDNVMGHVWMKFVLNVALNPVAAITGLRPGEIARTPPALAMVHRILDEALAVVAAEGLTLPEADPRGHVVDHAFTRYNRPSMLQHVEAGRRTEIDSLNGALVRAGGNLGVPCPFNEAIVLAVKAIEARAALRAANPQVDEAALEAAARREAAAGRASTA
jgi:2-dehydropantoate 2-reductase